MSGTVLTKHDDKVAKLSPVMASKDKTRHNKTDAYDMFLKTWDV